MIDQYQDCNYMQFRKCTKINDSQRNQSWNQA